MDKSMPLVWEETQRVYASDTDFRAGGKLSFILDIMQHAADSAVADMGNSLEEMLGMNMGWMLMTLDVQIGRPLRQGDQLTVRTWCKGTKGPLWLRDFRIFDGQGYEAVSARSVWVLVDTTKRKILRPNVFPAEIQFYTGDSVGDIPEKVVTPQDIALTEAYRYQVRYSGLDNYGHLNNARYGDLCSDALPLTVFEKKQLRHFRISYLQEATYGEEMIIQVSPETSEGFYVRGLRENKVYFEASLDFDSE
ncbi:acyl-[acyl-carrier-protein] thioesterase [Paenibacillus sabinae]|uniref:Acyl-ACP thioesterase n=1 Tax=Paenibacillus sabinae T27 TaxID=1268072 RepID=X4ZFJ3_9BACL|nr:acyl-ACP thioesterase domain-containing protein [Paenibacillus sabinae]AHV95535.1 acyl-ACP thioesterase [Paenibacillus sabinae T27]